MVAAIEVAAVEFVTAAVEVSDGVTGHSPNSSSNSRLLSFSKNPSPAFFSSAPMASSASMNGERSPLCCVCECLFEQTKSARKVILQSAVKKNRGVRFFLGWQFGGHR